MCGCAIPHAVFGATKLANDAQWAVGMRAFWAVALSKPPFFMSSNIFWVLSSFTACAEAQGDLLHLVATY